MRRRRTADGAWGERVRGRAAERVGVDGDGELTCLTMAGDNTVNSGAPPRL